VHGGARALIGDRLIDSVVVIERIERWRKEIDRSVFHDGTFRELRKFLGRRAARRSLKKRRDEAIERAALRAATPEHL
jgi:hypothetical protein